MTQEISQAEYRRLVRRSSSRMPEGELVAAVLAYLAIRGCYAWRNNTGGYWVESESGRRYISYGKVGSADVLGVAPNGVFLAVECKTASGTLRPEQQEFIGEVQARGGVALVVRPDDYVELIDGVLSGEG